MPPASEHQLGLLSLPNEILLDIFPGLYAHDLLSLAVLCRRLHYLALPLYFSFHGLPEHPSNLDEDSMQAFPGLCISLFTTSLQNLSLSLQYGESIFPLLSRLEEFVLRLDKIDAVRINLWLTTRWHISVDADKLQKRLGGLLEAVVSRSQKLEVEGGIILHDPVRLPRSLSVKKKGYSDAKRSETLEFGEHNDQKIPTGALRRLAIRSPMLLRPPFIDWTLQTLKRYSITSLSLEASEILLYEWAFLLRTIELPGAQSCLAHQTGYPQLRWISLITPLVSWEGAGPGYERDVRRQAKELDHALSFVARRANAVELKVQFMGAQAQRLIYPNSEADNTTTGRQLPYITHLEVVAPDVEPRFFLPLLPKWLSVSFPGLRVLQLGIAVTGEAEQRIFSEAVRVLVPQIETVKFIP